MNRLRPFHLAIPIDNLEKAKKFYGELLGFEEGRSTDHWIDYNFFGEIGIGEDLNEGTPVGSGASFDYLRFGVSRTFFNSFRVNLNYRSKMKAHDRDLNWIVINTKYRF